MKKSKIIIILALLLLSSFLFVQHSRENPAPIDTTLGSWVSSNEVILTNTTNEYHIFELLEAAVASEIIDNETIYLNPHYPEGGYEYLFLQDKKPDDYLIIAINFSNGRGNESLFVEIGNKSIQLLNTFRCSFDWANKTHFSFYISSYTDDFSFEEYVPIITRNSTEFFTFKITNNDPFNYTISSIGIEYLKRTYSEGSYYYPEYVFWDEFELIWSQFTKWELLGVCILGMILNPIALSGESERYRNGRLPKLILFSVIIGIFLSFIAGINYIPHTLLDGFLLVLFQTIILFSANIMVAFLVEAIFFSGWKLPKKEEKKENEK